MGAPRSIAGAVALSGRWRISHEPHTDPLFWPEMDTPPGMTVRNLLSVPLKTRDSAVVVGVLQASNKKSATAERSAARFTSWDVSALVAVAEESVLALEELQQQ